MHRSRSFIGAMILLAAGTMAVGQEAKPDPAAIQFFEMKVRPLLADTCYECHGSQKQKASLRLDSAAALKKGGDSGPVVVPGNPAESLLIKAVKHEGPKMPPKKKLKPEEIAVLTEWVKRGALWPESKTLSADALNIETAKKTYWAFRPVAQPQLPQIKDPDWSANPVDRFIMTELEKRGLAPIGPADKRTLIRRATFDLTGLPPTPAEIDAFLTDDSPHAFVKVVDRLLATSAYGERWGRRWLDVVRYADTAGDNSDYPVPQLYKYRNWVIQAFNDDKPYDQFVREQIAGDLLPSANDQDKHQKLIATGYLANARRFGSYADDGTPPYPWHLTIEDTIDNLGRTFLGLTINCCRCHDHKFDPMTNEDYYALYGFFQNTRYPWPGIELDKVPKDLIPLVPDAEVENILKERNDKQSAMDAEIKRLEGEKTAADKSQQEAEKLDKGPERDGKIAEAKKRADELNKVIAAARKDRDLFTKKPLPFETAYAVTERQHETKKKLGNACIQIKGDPERLGKEVPRRFPMVLGGQVLSADAKGSGRLQLAQWLTDPANPLAARVMVNRIWQYHFGKGIVATPSDFGKQGMPPTHPALLDYLARYFMASGGREPPVDGTEGLRPPLAWSIKKMHRLIMLSRTYQLASQDHADNLQKDPNNDYLWRFSRHRLDAEAIRDTMLAVSGGLDRTVGGAHPFPDQTTWTFTQHAPFKGVYDTNRRSVYLMTQRIQRHPYLTLFDGADTNTSTGKRLISTTPLQALFLMNDPFAHEQAKKLATRLLAERTDDPGRIERAYLLMLGRPVTPEERSAAESYLAQVREKLQAAGVPAAQQAAKAWESLARALFMSNEFVYVN
jgi:hypothetical protein